MSSDRLDSMFSLRESFMKALKQKKSDISPEWPVDLGDKHSQQHIRDMALRGVEEMFEALQHLKNWKPHRDTEVKEFDREEFLEEIVDAFNYFLSVLVLVGVSSDELFNAYEKKDKIIRERVKSGY
jgi:NTP pyrophosphatase (non-canonical NTP hydrolase)